VFTADVWKDVYNSDILSSDHPLITLFAKTRGEVNALDKYLLTPLHYAASRNNLSGVKQLIHFGAHIEVSGYICTTLQC
jgi:ankyrin repeat protein